MTMHSYLEKGIGSFGQNAKQTEHGDHVMSYECQVFLSSCLNVGRRQSTRQLCPAALQASENGGATAWVLTVFAGRVCACFAT